MAQMKSAVEDLKDERVPPSLYWTVDQVADWIEDLGFPYYRSCITDNMISGRKLIYIDASHFPNIGITDFEHIKIIAKSIRDLLTLEEPNWNKSISLPPRSDLATDEKKKDGFVRVIVAMKNLTTSSQIVRKGLLPKAVKKPANAKLDLVFENQGFCLTVDGEKGEMKGKHIQLKIVKLPHEIDSDKSYHEVDDDRVLLFLCKRQNKSWYPELENGLETAEEEEEQP